MKQYLAKIACGFAAASLALALAACDDSSSANNAGDNPEFSSDSGNGSENIESSATAGSSSAATVNSSTTANGDSSASNGNSSASANGNSSASVNGNSSANVVESSSSKVVSSTSVQSNTPKYSNTCANIYGVTGNDRWNCNETDFTLTTDCNDNTITYMCVSKRWFKTSDCDAAKPNCGHDDYTICQKTKLKEYCLKTEWLNESCNYGEDPIRWLYIYDNPDDPDDLGYDREERYSCNQNGKWEKIVYQCDPMKDCGDGKSDDKGILPDNAPCKNEGEQLTVEGFHYQCINNVWTRI